MKKSVYPILLLILILPGINALAQKSLTIEDCMTGALTYLQPADMEQISWRPNTSFFTYVEGDKLIQMAAKGGKKTELVALDLLKYFSLIDKLSTLSDFPDYKWLSSDDLIFNNETDYITYNLKSGIYHTASLEDSAENMDVSPSGSHIAYTVENNLYIYDYSSGKKIDVSINRNKGIVSGQTVSRNEFGISGGTFWSPKGTILAFYVKDETSVTGYPLVDVTQRVAGPEMIKYPMAGMASEILRIGLYNTLTGSVTFLNTGTPDDHYLTNIAWTPDEKEIYIAEINRGQDHVKMNRYSAATGACLSTIFEETDDKYIDPLSPVKFLPGKNDAFIWQSRKDGFNHLYLYSGGNERQITSGSWEVLSLTGFDESGTGVFFTATKDGYLNEMLYKADISSGAISLLTPEPGIHEVILNSYAGMMIDRYNSFNVPNVISLKDINENTLAKPLEASNPLESYTLASVETETITAADGKTELAYRMFKPAGGIMPGVKYPAIVYVYNGPLNQLIRNGWITRNELWLSYMTDQGYIGFIVEGRGTANRGKEFEQVVFRSLGVHEMEDQVKGVEFLMSLDYIDPERIGIFGWSYGGFMTTSLMTSYPDLFKAGVAGGPVTDWKYYEVMYGERYMDTPEENPEGYYSTSVLEKAGNLKGKLMIIHGAMDPVVVWQHSLMLLKRLIDEDIMVDYFVYPTHEHNVTGEDRVHLMKKVTDFLINNL